MSISAITGKDTIHREVSVLPQARIPSIERYQCYLEQGCFPRSISAPHQPPKGRGVLTKNTSAPSQLMLLLLNYIWMTPDVVPTRTIHHRFLILKKPGNLTMYLCPWCKGKSIWRQPVVYIVETGFTVFEVN